MNGQSTGSIERSEYLEWLSKNVESFECARCGAVCNGERRETRFGTVDIGCYLAWRSSGKFQQRELSQFVAATDGGSWRSREEGGRR